MLAGFRGHLISEQFLEGRLADTTADDVSATLFAKIRQWRDSQQQFGPATSLRALLESGGFPLARILGFESIADVVTLRGITVGTLRGRNAHAVLAVTQWGDRLDLSWRPAIVEARRRGAPWCVLFNGTHVRLLNADRVFSRRFAEFDLDAVADDEQSARALLLLFAAGSLAAPIGVRSSSLDTLIELSDRHASEVCRSLRDGVLVASEHVLRALVDRPQRFALDAAFEQALTIVYRMLFLFFAEGRALVPSWHPIYRSSYSLERLAERAAESRPVGLWDALRAVARLAHAGCHAGDLRVTPFNGRLFAPTNTPLADRRDLDDESARQSLIALSTRPARDREGRERIAYRDLGVEQLGAVYETLLDYTPAVEPVGSANRVRPTVKLVAGSGIRKATGTFYTPQSIADYLIRSTLGPLVRNATPEAILQLKVVDPSMGSGAFLVGACAYLSDAYETALLAAGRCHPTDLGSRERAAIRRTIAERCLYGVDLNPMAVQLARLSLWLATLAANRPLSFLDHHLLVGNSLLGTWLRCLRQSPAVRRPPTEHLPLFDNLPVADTVRAVLPVRFSLACEPNDTPEQVRTKERALAALSARESALSKWKRVANLWCASWFATELRPSAGLFATLCDELLSGRSALPREHADVLLRRADQAAIQHRFFHWELEFPEVFFDVLGERRPDGGFDAVLGNPPWDMIRADEGDDDRRSRTRLDTASIVRFTRESGVYEAQSDGHANRYQLFVERSVALLRPGGRFGLVLPSGLAADQGSAALRRLLFSRCNLDALIGFDNRRAIFPIHRSVRFLLATATAGAATNAITCRLGEADPGCLETTNEDHAVRSPIRLTPMLLKKLSGDDLSIPDLRSQQDLAIAEKAATLFPPAGDAPGWAIHFGRELNATDDRGAFREPGHGMAVVEGRMLDPYRVCLDRARFSIGTRDARRLLGERHLSWRLAYRDVASATNRLTLIAALLPPDTVSTHTLFCLRTRLSLQAQYFLCGAFNSFVVNYLTRLRVVTHVTTAIVERLPIPSADDAGSEYEEIASIARRLAKSANGDLESRLNALVAKLYQLTEDEFSHVLGTFPLIPKEHRDAAYRKFRSL